MDRGGTVLFARPLASIARGSQNTTSTMNASLTFNTITFVPALPPAGRTGSYRQSSARGITLPDSLSIEASPYTDSKLKQPGVRRSVRIAGVYADASGAQHEIAFVITPYIPNAASLANVNTVLATMKAAVADAGFMTDVLENES